MAVYLCFFFFNDTATTEIYTLSLHDALPISLAGRKLYKLMIDESLKSSVDCYSPCILMGEEPYSSLGWQLAESIKPQILEQGLQNEQEYSKMYEGLKTLANQKGSFVTYSRLFSVLGRK